MERAALYIRVSTEDQVEYSPAAQKHALMEYAKKNNMIVSEEHIYSDEGFSGRTVEKRPAFMKMIGVAKLKDKPFDVILVHKFDRFARSREASIVYKSQLRKDCNVRVISTTESIDDEKMSIIMEAMLEAMAEYYSINLSEEVKKGMTEKAKRGEFQTSPPLGYKVDDNNTLQMIEEEAKHIRYIFDQYVNHGKGCFPIARALNQMGVTSKRGNKLDNRGIQYILSNPVYIGMVRWTPTEKIRRNFDHPDSIIERGNHEPIISEELFQLAGEKLRKSKLIVKPHARPLGECKHWLSGIVKCSDCGSTLILAATLKSPSFQCRGYTKGQCRISHSIAVKKLENAILGELSRVMAHIDQHDFQVKIRKVDNTESEIEALKKQLINIRKQGDRASQAYLNEIYSLEEYSQIKKAHDKEIAEINAHIDLLINRQPETSKVHLQSRIHTVLDLLQSDCEMERKQAALRSMIDKMVYDKENEQLEIYYYSQ